MPDITQVNNTVVAETQIPKIQCPKTQIPKTPTVNTDPANTEMTQTKTPPTEQFPIFHLGVKFNKEVEQKSRTKRVRTEGKDTKSHFMELFMDTQTEKTINDLVSVVKILTEEVKILKVEIKKLSDGTATKINNNTTEPKIKPLITTSSKSSLTTTTTNNNNETGQGNDWKTVGKTTTAVRPRSWSNIVRNKKDTVVIEKVAEMEVKELSEVNITSSKLLTNPPPQPPKTQNITAVRVENVKSRKLASAKIWREELKKNSINPVSILFPRLTTVEILVNTEEKDSLINFIHSLKKTPANPNPFARKDGKLEPLPSEIILKTALHRIEMMRFETSIAGLQYLKDTTMESIPLMNNSDATTMRLQMQEVLNMKRLI